MTPHNGITYAGHVLVLGGRALVSVRGALATSHA